ncbi:rhodanese-like domain-containing protein [Acidiphilium sp. PA]|uniref:rhodanese-like domain-containing protein n=1 Tax=Acidiphilium sp. PA TaxID=2871705 RepID=UPI002243E2A5|nr:rhodanese-like domain-containing protein [Acidiphilium sp. PA]MCW8305759.1 rhodanese-like domain-containing protein [Acidiphilium sp. PA]
MIDDVAPKQVWEALMTHPDAVLIDVRTTAEWNFVGMPDLSQTGKHTIPIQWQVFPTMQPNPHFLDQVKDAGLTEQHHLYFICRTGGRSMAAADSARNAGFKHVYNVKDGFEGPHDQRGHRGHVAGWKHDGLPWTQK